MCHEAGMKIWVQILTKPALQNLKGPKREKVCTNADNFLFLFYDMPCNIYATTHKKLTQLIVPMRTTVKIMQHNRLDAKRFLNKTMKTN